MRNPVYTLVLLATVLRAVAAPTTPAQTETQPNQTIQESIATSTDIRNQHMGVCTHFIRKKGMKHWDPKTYMPALAELGVGWIRDEVLWSQIEVEKGVYKMRWQDMEWINLAHENNIKIILTVAGGSSFYGEDSFDPEGYAKLCAYLAEELKGKVDVFEVQNEPFHHYASHYGEGTKKGGDWYGLTNGTLDVQGWVDHYRITLNKAADAVKAVNPDAKVIGLGSFPAINYRQIEAGLSENVDGITAHPYSYRVVPEIMPYKDNEKTIEKNGGRRVTDEHGTFASFIEMQLDFSAKHNGPDEMWLTEWGYSSFRERWEGDPNKWGGNYWGFNDHAVAVYAQRRFVEGLGLGVEVSVYYSLLDDDYSQDDPLKAESNSENHFGLITKDGERKPVYFAIQKVAKLTDGFTVSDELDYEIVKGQPRPDSRPVNWWNGSTIEALDEICNYQFKDANGDNVLAVWSMERVGDRSARAANITIDVPFEGTKVEVTDLMTGKVYEAFTEDKDGKLFLPHFAVPPHVVLIRLVR
ncbi:hypothetical protein [Cerasicoccus maritimus]|uniref:hypothetical protein n=1 Tax=Cerasicoccus maritimus TaxID=490089 RepID=UPI002852D831|nr:hypothetical protein [Cerasicoccus maritimus]